MERKVFEIEKVTEKADRFKKMSSNTVKFIKSVKTFNFEITPYKHFKIEEKAWKIFKFEKAKKVTGMRK